MMDFPTTHSWFQRTLAATLCLPALALAEYYPLITTPAWVEVVKTDDGYGMTTVDTRRNLISVGSDGPVIPIRPPIQFGNVIIESITDLSDPILGEQTLTTLSSYDVSPDALSTMQLASVGVDFSHLTNYWHHNTEFCIQIGRGYPLIRPSVEIGRVYDACHTQVSTTTTPADAQLGTPGFTQETTALIRTRLVYAGVETVDNLFPGADITLVTGPFQALVSIQELDLELTTRTTYEDNRPPDVDTTFSSSTAVSWLVDNIGVVKSVLAFGEYLDPLLNAPAFDSGDGVVSVNGFDEIVPPYDIVHTTLRASGGNLADAADADIASGEVVIYDLSAMPWLLTEPPADADRDGVADTLDRFPNERAASVDTDRDGRPDDWHANCDLACQDGSGLTLDYDDDNDGITDDVEVTYGLDPRNAADGALDLDADGFSNREEAERGTSLSDPSSPASSIDAAVTLFSSVLPSSRSVSVGSLATAFATVVNAGTANATGCRVALMTPFAGDFFYQTTDPATNAPTGTQNTPANLAAGQVQSFIVGLTPDVVAPTTDVAFGFRCDNGSDAPVTSGLNTLQFTAAGSPVPDVVALAATLQGDGIVHVPGTAGTGVFTVATVNVGAAGTVTVTADTASATLPVSLFVCQTDPLTAACVNPPAPAASVSLSIGANETPTFGVFAAGDGTIALDPAGSRVFVRFADPAGVLRGSTSVAIQTD